MITGYGERREIGWARDDRNGVGVVVIECGLQTDSYVSIMI